MWDMLSIFLKQGDNPVMSDVVPKYLARCLNFLQRAKASKTPWPLFLHCENAVNDVLNCLRLSHPLFLFFFILQWMGRNRRHRGRFVNCSPARGGSRPCSGFRSENGFNDFVLHVIWSTVRVEYWLSLILQKKCGSFLILVTQMHYSKTDFYCTEIQKRCTSHGEGGEDSRAVNLI